MQILVRAGTLGALMTLMACGQQGPLYLPQTEGRSPASLPQTLLQIGGAKDAATAAQVPVSGVKPPVSPTAQ